MSIRNLIAIGAIVGGIGAIIGGLAAGLVIIIVLGAIAIVGGILLFSREG